MERSLPGLSDDEAAAWLHLVAVTTWLPAALDIQLERDEGVSSFEYGVLAALARSETRSLRIKELTRGANGAFSRISRVIDRFESRGWVTRCPDPADGRSTLVELTRVGQRKVAAATPAHVAQIRRLVFDRLPADEVEHLGRIASKIAAAAGPDGACASRMG